MTTNSHHLGRPESAGPAAPTSPRWARWNPSLLLVLGVLLLTLTAGCGSDPSPFRSIERAVEQEMTARVGPAAAYRARVSRSGGNLVAGRIPWIEIEGKEVRLEGNLVLETLLVRLEGVRFDRGKREMTGMNAGVFTATVTPEAVTAAVRQRGPRLQDVRVRLRGAEIVVDASPALLGIGVPVQVEGRPVLRDEARIDFDVSRLAVLRIGLPGLAVRRLEEAINPIVDLSAMRLPVRATEVRVWESRLRVAGRIATEPWAPGATHGSLAP